MQHIQILDLVFHVYLHFIFSRVDLNSFIIFTMASQGFNEQEKCIFSRKRRMKCFSQYRQFSEVPVLGGLILSFTG